MFDVKKLYLYIMYAFRNVMGLVTHTPHTHIHVPTVKHFRQLTWTWVSHALLMLYQFPRTVIPAMEGSNAGPVSVLATIRTTRVCTLCPVRPHLPYTVNFKLET